MQYLDQAMDREQLAKRLNALKKNKLKKNKLKF